MDRGSTRRGAPVANTQGPTTRSTWSLALRALPVVAACILLGACLGGILIWTQRDVPSDLSWRIVLQVIGALLFSLAVGSFLASRQSTSAAPTPGVVAGMLGYVLMAIVFVSAMYLAQMDSGYVSLILLTTPLAAVACLLGAGLGTAQARAQTPDS